MSYHNTETNKTDGAYTDPNQNPDLAKRWEYENILEYKEEVYNKISLLLLSKFSEIEPYLNGTGIEALQKTYKDGNVVTGKQDNDMMVVYESDIDANDDGKYLEDTLLRWLDFSDPAHLTLSITPIITTADTEDNVGPPPLPNLILHAPNRDNFNLNEVLGVLGLDDINLKNNASQFMGIKKTKTITSRSKLSEYIDTEFSEMAPLTFTHLLEKYNVVKKDIPFYRYRTDDFFVEYTNSVDIPIEYRIEKLFDEFVKIKSQIPPGKLAGISQIVDVRTEQALFGYGTMTYLLKEARSAIGDNAIPEWSNSQVMKFINEIDALNADVNSLISDVNYWKELYQAAIAGVGELTTLGDGPVGTVETIEEIPEGYIPDPFADYSDLDDDGDVDIQDVILSVRAGLPIFGCTDTGAENYTEEATDDDGSCIYIYGCMDVTATNYNGSATKDDNSCEYSVGCKDEIAENYDETAVNKDNDLCIYVWGCMEAIADNHNAAATKDDGSCIYSIGCKDPNATNYDPSAVQTDNYLCTYAPTSFQFYEEYDITGDRAVNETDIEAWKQSDTPEIGTELENIFADKIIPPDYRPPVLGCMDPDANNYNSAATEDDYSCEYGKYGCTYSTAWNYDPTAVNDDGSCACIGEVATCPAGKYGKSATKNLDTCICDYPSVTVASWTRKSSNCTNYNFTNTKADCDCKCKDNLNLGLEKHNNKAGGDCARSGNDDSNCEGQCNTWCAGIAAETFSSKP